MTSFWMVYLLKLVLRWMSLRRSKNFSSLASMATTSASLHMVKQVPAKHLRWKAQTRTNSMKRTPTCSKLSAASCQELQSSFLRRRIDWCSKLGASWRFKSRLLKSIATSYEIYLLMETRNSMSTSKLILKRKSFSCIIKIGRSCRRSLTSWNWLSGRQRVVFLVRMDRMIIAQDLTTYSR